MPFIVLIVLLLGGGTSYVAESALPGDALYGVKVNVNEGVRSALAFTPQSEATLQTELASRRLEEAEALADKGELTPVLTTTIVQRFESSTERVKTEIEKMNDPKDAIAAADLTAQAASSLNTHGYILKAIGLKKGGDVEESVNIILPAVESKVTELGKDREDHEDRVSGGSSADVESAAQGKMGAAENKIAVVKKAIERAKARNNEWDATEATARLDAAQKVFAQGQASLNAKEYNKAFLYFVQSMSIAQEAMTLAQASNYTNIQIGIASSTEAVNSSDDDASDEVEDKERELPRPGLIPPRETWDGVIPAPGGTGLGSGTLPWTYVLPKSWSGGGSPFSDDEDDDQFSVEGVVPTPGSTSNKLKACPEEWIVNEMPKVGTPSSTDADNQYFIYKGARRELSEFDVYWIKLNCSVQPQTVE